MQEAVLRGLRDREVKFHVQLRVIATLSVQPALHRGEDGFQAVQIRRPHALGGQGG